MEKNSIDRITLIRALELVRPALASQEFIKALTYVAFDGDSVQAYNDISCINVAFPSPLRLCLPGDLLIRALNGFNSEALLCQEDDRDGALVISSGRSKVKLPTIKYGDYPHDPCKGDPVELVLESEVLTGIRRCKATAGNDPHHPAQMGVTLDAHDGRAVLYSTDNATISRYQTKAKLKLPGGVPVVMPTFFCEQLLALAKAFPDEQITLLVYAGRICAEIGRVATLWTRTMADLQAMDFASTIQRFCNIDKLDKLLAPIPAALDSAVNRHLTVLGGEVDKITKVTMGDGVFQMSSRSTAGEADDRIAIEGDHQTPDAFHVDPALWARALKGCGSIALLERAILLADGKDQFIHLISHSSK